MCGAKSSFAAEQLKTAVSQVLLVPFMHLDERVYQRGASNTHDDDC